MRTLARIGTVSPPILAAGALRWLTDAGLIAPPSAPGARRNGHQARAGRPRGRRCATLAGMSNAAVTLFGALGAVAAMLAVLLPVILTQGLGASGLVRCADGRNHELVRMPVAAGLGLWTRVEPPRYSAKNIVAIGDVFRWGVAR